jgi:hypothetical protein
MAQDCILDELAPICALLIVMSKVSYSLQEARELRHSVTQSWAANICIPALRHTQKAWCYHAANKQSGD